MVEEMGDVRKCTVGQSGGRAHTIHTGRDASKKTAREFPTLLPT